MAFPRAIVEQAFQRQAGLCAHCGKPLVIGNRDRQAWGGWHAHHRRDNGGDSLRNCVLLCMDLPEHCHLNIGHGGDFGQRASLRDGHLPYLDAAPSSERPCAAGAFSY